MASRSQQCADGAPPVQAPVSELSAAEILQEAINEYLRPGLSASGVLLECGNAYRILDALSERSEPSRAWVERAAQLLLERNTLAQQVRGYQLHLRECEQAAGRALGYPWFKDDQKNFPGATEADGVCIGEHIGETIVEELAARFAALSAEAASSTGVSDKGPGRTNPDGPPSLNASPAPPEGGLMLGGSSRTNSSGTALVPGPKSENEEGL